MTKVLVGDAMNKIKVGDILKKGKDKYLVTEVNNKGTVANITKLNNHKLVELNIKYSGVDDFFKLFVLRASNKNIDIQYETSNGYQFYVTLKNRECRTRFYVEVTSLNSADYEKYINDRLDIFNDEMRRIRIASGESL